MSETLTYFHQTLTVLGPLSVSWWKRTKCIQYGNTSSDSLKETSLVKLMTHFICCPMFTKWNRIYSCLLSFSYFIEPFLDFTNMATAFVYKKYLILK